MGYIRHDAIIVTGMKECYDKRPVQYVYDKAIEFGLRVTSIAESGVNGYVHFLIIPDGSKEGWDTSDEGDVARNKWKAFIKANRELSWQISFVHVKYGGDDQENCYLVDHSGKET